MHWIFKDELSALQAFQNFSDVLMISLNNNTLVENYTPWCQVYESPLRPKILNINLKNIYNISLLSLLCLNRFKEIVKLDCSKHFSYTMEEEYFDYDIVFDDGFVFAIYFKSSFVEVQYNKDNSHMPQMSNFQ
jgi:hypothetical protein